MSSGIRIENASLVDPANSAPAMERPLYIKNGKIAATAGEDATTLDASGCVALAGGIDIHTHLIGPMAELARDVAKESGIEELASSVSEAAKMYAAMGYTTIVDPAIYPALARKTHMAARGAPIIDRCFLALLGPGSLVGEILEKGDDKELEDYIAWLVNGSGAYGLKAVNPKSSEDIRAIGRAVASLDIDHPVHLHLPDLGEGGGFRSAIDAITALEGIEAHIAHMQFHCYEGRNGRTISRAHEIAKAVNANENISIDVGQIVFGGTVTVSADTKLIDRIERVTKGKVKSLDAGWGEKCKATPYTYDPSSYINSLQWVTGLELFLSIMDPWRVCLSTDHPNAGPFTAYPEIVKLLMDKDYRNHRLSKIHPKVIEESALKKMDREYSLREIAIITRAGPARRLGLAGKGALQVGADADVAIYRKGGDIMQMFIKPAWVIKGGVIVAKNGRIVKTCEGKTFYAPLSTDERENAKWKERVSDYCPDGLKNFPVEKKVIDGGR